MVQFSGSRSVSSTLSEQIAQEFDTLAHENKIIFVPFHNNLTSNIYLEYEDKHDGITIGMRSNRTANGSLNLIDLLALLNQEKNFIRTS
jgi:uncharacterized protein (DUF1919 family)